MDSVRLPIALALACVITFGLFWSMQALIGTSRELQEGTPPPHIDFVRLRRDNTPQEKKREPPKREKPEQPPPPPDISMSKSTLDPGEGIAAIGPRIDPTAMLDGGLSSGAGTDRDVVPLVRIEPDYPIRARQRNIEGWVQVQFDVNKAGAVEDAFVVDSNPSTLFDRAAIQAVLKWKYNPKILNGVAVGRKGLQVVFPFEMER
ncbi:MAG: TonB family protein [Myxococcota bacterium]|nr:TonB family protein [Myxococcota bacterium]